MVAVIPILFRKTQRVCYMAGNSNRQQRGRKYIHLSWNVNIYILLEVWWDAGWTQALCIPGKHSPTELNPQPCL